MSSTIFRKLHIFINYTHCSTSSRTNYQNKYVTISCSNGPNTTYPSDDNQYRILFMHNEKFTNQTINHVNRKFFEIDTSRIPNEYRNIWPKCLVKEICSENYVVDENGQYLTENNNERNEIDFCNLISIRKSSTIDKSIITDQHNPGKIF